MKNKLMFSALLLLCFSILYSAVLPLPLCVQERDQWCWAGASQAIFHYYNLPITQTEIAQYGTEGINTWNWLYGNSENPTRRGISMILDNFAGFSTLHGEYVLSLAEAAMEIDSLQPFVTRIGWTGGGGHFIDCHGYNQNNIYLMDPWPGNGFTISDYDWYHNGSAAFTWTHTLSLNSEPGLRAYFSADSINGYAPLSVEFHDYSTGIPTAWFWDFNNDAVFDSQIQNPIWNFTQHIVYTISLTVTKGAESHTITKENYIDVYDYLPELIENLPDITIAVNQTYTGLNLYNYFYDADNDTLSFTFTNPQSVISGSINAGILTLTPALNWTGTTNCFVRCTDNFLNQVSDMFSVTVSDSVGIEDETDRIIIPGIAVYPNPFRGTTNIKISNPTLENIVLSIYNAKGQKIATQKIPAKSNNSLDWHLVNPNCDALASGIYFLKLDSKLHQITKKILLLR